ncbi:hypothetical protein [Spirillospora sp. CA-294931]|uniref:hypothetical protein n=1 Tax=Spirillospora sp. CA-294931 TaxID=3240042 RepID=UPI003D8D5AEF
MPTERTPDKNKGTTAPPRPDLCVPARTLIIALIVIAGIAVAAVAAVLPEIGLPVGTGVAVIGLLYAIYTKTDDR